MKGTRLVNAVGLLVVLIVGVLAEERSAVAVELVVVGVVEVGFVLLFLLPLALVRRRMAVVGHIGGLSGRSDVGTGGESRRSGRSSKISFIAGRD